MKHFILALVLVLGFNTQPLHVSADSIELTKPGIKIETIKKAKEIVLAQYSPAKYLEYASFKYAPVGTYANSFPSDQCTYGVASMKGNITWTGNANEWDDRAVERGITVSDVPIVGAIAQSDRGASGHVAVVTAVYPDYIEIFERNYDYHGSDRTRPASYDEFKYIYL